MSTILWFAMLQIPMGSTYVPVLPPATSQTVILLAPGYPILLVPNHLTILE